MECRCLKHDLGVDDLLNPKFSNTLRKYHSDLKARKSIKKSPTADFVIKRVLKTLMI